MNKINYQKELDNIIDNIYEQQATPTLLLHSCCAPCSSYCLEYLSKYFSITVLYYNPNISPENEYYTRVKEQVRLINSLPAVNRISFMEGDYKPEVFYNAVRGYENEPEGGARCSICYELRLREAARIASEHNFDYFTTTLSISPLKDADRLNNIGGRLAKEYGVNYLFSDFKKKNGYKRSIELSKEYNLYRQNFCGCVYSRMEAEKHNGI